MSITVTNLRKAFHGSHAVFGLDLEVRSGEMLVLLGASGSGKTTTMRCIAGLETPDSGSINIGDRTVFDYRSRVNVPVNRRNIGMVFQSYAIWPHMTVAENVGFPLLMARLPRLERETRVMEMLDLVGLQEFSSRGASYLSGGQMQRVALARSLVMRPEVLLFDEPLSNLDARLRDHLRIQLREIQTQLNITGVYVTHDQREALAVADRIAVMQSGSILQIDDPISLYTHPRSRTVAEFIGYSNIFEASVADCEAGSTAVLLWNGDQLFSASEAPGGGFSVCVRPEDVTISGVDGMVPGRNTVFGEVGLRSFAGDSIQYRVRGGGGVVWDISCKDCKRQLPLGTQVQLKILPENVLLLPNG